MRNEFGLGRTGMALLLIGFVVASLISARVPTPTSAAETPAQHSLDAVQGTTLAGTYKIPTESPVAQSIKVEVTADPTWMQGGGNEPNDPPFDPNVRVWGDANEQSRPTIVVNPKNGFSYIAFQHFNGADWDILLTKSAGSGSPWSTPIAIASTAANEVNPRMTVTSTGILAVVYTNDGNPDELDLLQSTDGGVNWDLFALPFSEWWSDAFTDIQFPQVAAQSTVGNYPRGIAIVFQAWCTLPADPVGPHCGGGAHVVVWIGTSDFSVSSVSFNLGGYFYYPWASRQANNNVFVDSLHPSVAWSNAAWCMAFDDEWYVPDAEWKLAWVVFPETGNPPFDELYLSNVVSRAGIYSNFAQTGTYGLLAGSFLNATTFPGNPSNHNVGEFHTSNTWANSAETARLDPATTDQRAASVAVAAGATPVFHLTYYSDAVMTDWWSDNDGANWNGPQKVSDNAGTAVNDDLATSVCIGADGAPRIAWQDNRDGNTNIYSTFGTSSGSSNDTTGPSARGIMTIPNPYIVNISTSLFVIGIIDDSLTGRSNITSAQLVLTDQTVDDPSMVDWTGAWAMNISGVNKKPIETAWLWANGTAAGWPVGSCHRFWIRGQDNKWNWGIGNHADVCVVTARVPMPPIMMKAVLGGSAFANVALTWAKSPDDGGGAGDVSHYNVSRSEDIGGPFSVVANVTATGSPDYTWTDPGAGHGDFRNLFYRVVASSTYRDSEPTRLAAKFYRTMSGGKQLVSFPLEQADNDPAVVFQTFSYTYARTYIAGTPNPWWCHKPGLFIDSLTELDLAQGYWVELDGPGTMTVAGLVPQNVVVGLKSGWNMIGFPTLNQTYTFADLNTAVGGVLQLVEMYDPSNGPYFLQKVLRNDWASTHLTTGYAYMIRVSSDANWAVPNS